MSDPTTHLFVYGTLRPGSGHPMADFLAARARRVGRARMPGRLYDLGPYPAMTAESGWVQGELYELHEPGDTLAALDRYEGCPDGREAAFEREQCYAMMEGGASVAAWVYYYRGPVAHGQHIPSGDYFDLA